MRAVSLPVSPVTRNRKDSTPRHGRLLHPSSWRNGMIAITSPIIFSKEVAQKQATPLIAPATSLTTRNRFTPSFRGWRLDEFSIFARPPPRGLWLTPGREAFHPMDAAEPDHLICPGRAGPLICLGRAGDACVVGALERVGDTLYGARVYVKLGRRLAHAHAARCSDSLSQLVRDRRPSRLPSRLARCRPARTRS